MWMWLGKQATPECEDDLYRLFTFARKENAPVVANMCAALVEGIYCKTTDELVGLFKKFLGDCLEVGNEPPK